MSWYPTNRGGSRKVATDTELMDALLLARAEYGKDAVVSDTQLSKAAPKHLAASDNYFQTFLSKRATSEQREALGLPQKGKYTRRQR